MTISKKPDTFDSVILTNLSSIDKIIEVGNVANS